MSDAVDADGLPPKGDYRRVIDLAYAAWTIIANAGEGDWTRESAEWQEAAANWRDRFHAMLDEPPMPEPEKIAALFHYTYERLASRHRYTTREESQVPWQELPDNNRHLMIDVVRTLLDQGAIDPGPNL